MVKFLWRLDGTMIKSDFRGLKNRGYMLSEKLYQNTLKSSWLLETRSFTSNSSLLASSNSAVTSSQANLSSASISQRRFRRSGLWLFLTVFLALLSTLWSTPSLQFFPWCNRHPRCDSGTSCGLLSPFFSLFFLVHSSSFRIRLEGPGFA